MSCSDLEGIKAISLVAEKETDLTLGRLVTGWATSMVAEESSVLTAWCRRGSTLCLGAGGKSTIKLLPSWQWFTKSLVAIVVCYEVL